ncbi:hypothetical protein FPOAC2_03622 [Fusarium poae]|jgi:hypothetical protein|uniref:2EXR domain-containing protein n=1 Tax=Fusarium poae TaxID=36050 RepID=A0A1B8B9K4_FUSPO|nr:hypothetical protein FPOAC1_003487 [Fusarium poae]KAG8677469.1 hypothetical protein FPOAC1_003487 [Fusarium poae]OBS29400.1 hypothetical protein FPOA_03336 [Fusarium poae]
MDNIAYYVCRTLWNFVLFPLRQWVLRPSQEQPPSPPSFPLHRLPPEIRDIIWNFTLPDRRVFVVEEFLRYPKSDMEYLGFGFRHPPPVTLQVCYESRAAALRAGFFFKTGKRSLGAWFRPETDMMCFYSVSSLTTSEDRHVQGLDKVLHVGIFSSTFLDFSYGKSSRFMMERPIRAIHSSMPSLETLNYIYIRHERPVEQEICSTDYRSASLSLPLSDATYRRWREMVYKTEDEMRKEIRTGSRY